MKGSAKCAGVVFAVCLGLGGLNGCVHNPVRAVVPIVAKSPVEMIEIPEPALPELAVVEAPDIEVPDASEIDMEMRRWRRKPWPKTITTAVVPAPLPNAAIVPPPIPLASVLGELSEGGGAAAGKQQEASTTLEATDRRLADLPSSVTRSKKTQVNQIREFQKKARAAIRSGDAEGAQTLATKASVLLDDLLK